MRDERHLLYLVHRCNLDSHDRICHILPSFQVNKSFSHSNRKTLFSAQTVDGAWVKADPIVVADLALDNLSFIFLVDTHPTSINCLSHVGSQIASHVVHVVVSTLVHHELVCEA